MEFSKAELVIIIEALEARVSDIESWVEEGETYHPLEAETNRARRNDLEKDRRLLRRFKAY